MMSSIPWRAFAVDQHAPGVGDLIGEGAALDDAADL